MHVLHCTMRVMPMSIKWRCCASGLEMPGNNREVP